MASGTGETRRSLRVSKRAVMPLQMLYSRRMCLFHSHEKAEVAEPQERLQRWCSAGLPGVRTLLLARPQASTVFPCWHGCLL